MSFADRREAIRRSLYFLHTWPRRYGLALIAVAGASLLRYALSKLLGANLPFLLFYPAIWLVAWMAGLGPGVFAVALSEVSAVYLLFGPANTSALGLPLNPNGLILFSIAGVALSALTDTYRKRAQRLQGFERAVEGLEEMIAVVDHDYRFVIANRAFLNYRNLERRDLIGRRVGETLNPGVFETTIKAKLDECLQGKIVQYEMRYRYPERGERDLFITYFPIQGPGGVNRVASVLQDITERKRSEQSLRLFRTLIDQSNDAVQVIDPETLRFLDVNERACKDLGYTREELLSLTVYDIDPGADEACHATVLGKLRDAGSVVKQTVHRRKDGLTFPVETSLKYVSLERDYVVAVSRDITDRKRADDALREREEKFRQVADNIQEIFWMVDSDSKQAIYVNPAFEQITGRTVASLLNAPLSYDEIIHPDHRAHVLNRLSEAATTGKFDEEFRIVRPDGTIRWVEAHGFPVCNADGKIYRLAGVVQDITARRLAEGALRDSEDRYRDLVQHSDDLVCTHDLEGRLLSVNPAPARVLGYEVAELIKIPMRDLIAPEAREQFDAYLERIKKTGADRGMLCVVTKTGERRIWEYSNTLRTEGVASPVVRGMARDITERKRAEAALRKSEQRYRLLFEQNVSGVAIATMEGEVVDCNDGWARILGYDKADEVRGRRASEFYFNLAEREPMLSELKQEGAFLSREMQLRRQDGTPIWVLFNAVVLDGGGYGTQLVQATAIDITERKQAEAALQRSEAHFRFLVEQASDGIFIADAQGKYLDVNSAGAEMLGYTREEILQLTVADVVVPEEAPRVLDERIRMQEGRAVRNEWKFRRKDGSFFPGEVSGKQLPDGRLQGILRDISERRQAEEAMRQSEERFRVALKDSPITVFSHDPELRYTWIYNPQLCWHEAIGKTDADIIGPKKAASLVDIKRRVLKEGVALREEVVIPHDGKNHAFDITVEPLFDAEGGIAGITGAAMDVARLREMTDRLQDARDRLAQEKLYLEREIQSELGFEEIIGQSPALHEVLKNVRVVAPTDSTVLLLGETGTGKELVARSVHSLSSRRDKTFIKLNSAAVPSGLLESELFGHEKGAFTGAVSQKVGRIELADKGTLFLDEIGELPLELQPKLLRVLQDREFERLGGVHTLHVDVRIISATNRDLREDIVGRRFREDLFYRLNVFPIELPSLRERRSDIPMLVHHFVRKHSARMGKHIDVVPDETMTVLQNWNWPGNIRELENMIERMVILSKDRELAAPPEDLDAPQESEEDNLTQKEREHIIRVLRETNGVLSGMDGAARRLGIKRTTLQSMIKRFGIEPREYRRGSGTFGAG